MKEKAVNLNELNIRIDEDIKLILKEISNIAKVLKVDIYMVGGFVRDLILYRRNKDLDFVILGNYFQFITELQKKIGGSLKVNERFLTGSLNLNNGINIDIARARKEYYPKSGSLPFINEGELIDDLRRRDFTVNTLLLDFKKLRSLKIYDYYNGINDIKERKIRILHKQSFKDDPTRIYRGIKLATSLNFDIEDQTLNLIKEATQNSYIYNVSVNRLFNEVLKCLEEKRSYIILEQLAKFGLLNFICEDIDKTRTAIYLIKEFEEKNNAIIKELKIREYNKKLVKIILLLHTLDTDNLKIFLNNTSLPKVKKEKIITFNKIYKQVMNKLKFNNISDYDTYSLLKKFGIEEIICYIIISGFDKKIKKRIKKYLFNLSNINIYITGEEIKDFGIEEGPVYAVLLEKIKERIINEKCTEKEHQIRIMKEIIKAWKEGNKVEHDK